MTSPTDTTAATTAATTASTAPASAAAPAVAATPGVAVKGKSKGLKTVAITAGVVAYLTAASLGVVYGSAAIYQLFRHQKPHDLTLTTSLDIWQATENDPKERKRFKIALGVPAAALFVVLPVLLAGLGSQSRELHGSARWANPMEVQKSGLKGSRGIILGRLADKFLMLDGALSVALSAPTRSGKGAGVVVPNLLNWPDSTVVLDVKPELYRITAGYRAKHGQEVYGWAPFAEDGCTHGYNPLAYVRTDYRYVVSDILNIAQIIYGGKQSDTSTSNFFLGNARNLFLALAMYLVETPELPRTIGEVLRLSSGRGRPIREFLQSLITDRTKAKRPLSDRCVEALSRVLSAADDTFTGIVNTLNEPLTLFTDALVDAATSRNDFDLRDLRKRRMSVYVMIPVDKLKECKVLLNLFYSQLVSLNTRHLPEFHPEYKYPCLLVNDEFTTMGRVDAFADGIGYMAGFGIRCLTIFQSRAQLQDKYGKESAKNFLTNHGAEILFAPKDQDDAEEYSRVLGHYTEKSESKSRSNNFGKGGGGSTSTNTSPQKRPLLYPQEFKDLGQDRAVVLMENVKPILADKIRYFEDPVFMERLLPAPKLPVVDLDLYRARLEGRIRQVQPGELFSVERIAADFQNLPDLAPDSPEADQRAFVAAFLDAMRVANAPVPKGAPAGDGQATRETSEKGNEDEEGDAAGAAQHEPSSNEPDGPQSAAPAGRRRFVRERSRPRPSRSHP